MVRYPDPDLNCHINIIKLLLWNRRLLCKMRMVIFVLHAISVLRMAFVGNKVQLLCSNIYLINYVKRNLINVLLVGNRQNVHLFLSCTELLS